MSVDPWKPWPPPEPAPPQRAREQLLIELQVEQHARPGPIRSAPYRHRDCGWDPCIDCGEGPL